MRRALYLWPLLLPFSAALAQSQGTLNLRGPSNTPGALVISTVGQLNGPINAALAAKADASNGVLTNPTLSGTIHLAVGATIPAFTAFTSGGVPAPGAISGKCLKDNATWGTCGSDFGSGPTGATGTLQYNAGSGMLGFVPLGTSTTVLHGNASGAPSFGSLNLATDVTGNLGISHLNGAAGASSTTYLRGDGAWTTPAGTSNVLLITDSGAACDRVTDDTAVLNAWLAPMKHLGAHIYIPANRACLIDSDDLEIPETVVIEGLASANLQGGPFQLQWTTGFVVNPAYSVVLFQNTRLRDIAVTRKGLLTAPTSDQVKASVAQWGTETSAGIRIKDHNSGQAMEHVFVVGFNACIRGDASVGSIDGFIGDCYNGLDIRAGGSFLTVNNLHLFPFYSLQVAGGSGAWLRPGIGIFAHGKDSFLPVLTNSYIFMYANCMSFDTSGGTLVNTHCEFDLTSAAGNVGDGYVGSVGLRVTGAGGSVDMIGGDIGGFDTDVSCENCSLTLSTNHLAGTNGSSGADNQANIYMSGLSATPRVITLTGTVTPGVSQVSATVTSAGLPSGAVTKTVTARTGDTLTTLLAALEFSIDQDASLIYRRFYASPVNDGTSFFVVWPGDVTTTVTASGSGGVTATVTNGSVQTGSRGTLTNNEFTPQPPLPNYMIGPNANTILINGHNASANQLAAGWLVTDISNRGRLLVTGYNPSPLVGGSVHDCSGGTFVAGASDAQGVLSEGANATSCTMDFTNWPFPWDPICTASSPTGATITGYVSTITTGTGGTPGLTVTNDSHAGSTKIAYRCS